MSELRIENLCAEVAGIDVLAGVDLTVSSGEVHVVMGPNGAGKSSLANVLMGRPGYRVTGGSVTLDGVDLLALPTHARALAGLFLAPQDPVEIPGVGLETVLVEALSARGRREDLARLRSLVATEATSIGLGAELFLDRALNVDASGGEKKRIETLQLAVLSPRIAILDELDSGLDVDALRQIARRVERAAHGDGIEHLGVLAVTHYTRLLVELHPDVVHVFVRGEIVARGGPELADELEKNGYGAYLAEEPGGGPEDLFATR